jgi:hypothetical protein
MKGCLDERNSLLRMRTPRAPRCANPPHALLRAIDFSQFWHPYGVHRSDAMRLEGEL